MTTFIGQPDGQWTLTGRRPSTYASSPGVERAFCSTCGSPLYFRAEHYPGETHFYAALLEDPGTVTPTAQVHADEQIHWMTHAMGLPKGLYEPGEG